MIGWAVLVYQLADAEGGVQLWRGCDGAGAPECAETVAGANEQEPGIRDQGIDPYRIAHDFGHSHLNTRLFLSDIEPEDHCMQWKSRSSLDGAFDDHAQGYRSGRYEVRAQSHLSGSASAWRGFGRSA